METELTQLKSKLTSTENELSKCKENVNELEKIKIQKEQELEKVKNQKEQVFDITKTNKQEAFVESTSSKRGTRRASIAQVLEAGASDIYNAFSVTMVDDYQRIFTQGLDFNVDMFSYENYSKLSLSL